MTLKMDNQKKTRFYLMIFVGSCVVFAWALFQPLMGAHTSDVPGEYHTVSTIEFLDRLWLYGKPAVICPWMMLLMFVLPIDLRARTAGGGILFLASLASFGRTWLFAKEFYQVIISPEIIYYYGTVAYPLALVFMAVSLFLCFYYANIEMEKENVLLTELDDAEW